MDPAGTLVLAVGCASSSLPWFVTAAEAWASAVTVEMCAMTHERSEHPSCLMFLTD